MDTRRAGMWTWPLIVAVLFVLPSLNDGLVSDDYVLIAEGVFNTPGDVLTAMTESGMQGFYRPIPRLLLGLNHLVHGLHPFGYHLINAVLHAVVVVILVKLFFAVTGASTISLIAGLLFAGHFVHVEPVYWISARNELLAALLYLFTLWWAVCVGGRLRFIALAMYLMALLTKETAVTLPLAVILLTGFNTEGVYKDRLRKGIYAALPFTGVLAGYGLLRWNAGADWPWTSREVGFGIDPLLVVKNAEQYAVQLMIPVRTLMDLRSEETYGAVTDAVRSGATDAGLWPWLLLGAILMTAGAWIVRKLGKQPATLGLAFTVVTVLPFLFMEGTGLRYLYLPSAGFTFTVAACVAGLADRWPDPLQGEIFQWWLIRIIICILLLLSLEQTRWWDRAGELCETTIERVLAYADTIPDDTTLYIFDIPRRVHGAYVFHNGFEEAIRLHQTDSSRRILDGERAIEREGPLPEDARIYRLGN